jgi:hypothetical protein
MRAGSIVMLWVLGVGLAYRHNWIFDYQSITRPISPWDSLAHGLPYFTSEAIALYAILRPQSFHNSWGRVLVAISIFAPLAAFWASLAMHAPGWVFAHIYWLVAVVCGLFVLLIVAGVSSWQARVAH